MGGHTGCVAKRLLLTQSGHQPDAA